ncbi:hypothetical protein [Marinicella litoralis]|uniref:hypothetical protein n=1 Tax=Marinicella litoralis TaxID=644220 RepID=UPI00105C2EF2|nr:hypothetical protein [Marinicella litoralis]
MSLSWVQILLLFLIPVLLLGAWFLSVWLVLLVPLILWQYASNRRMINQQLDFTLVMNAVGEWRLVQTDNQLVLEARLQDYWVTPFFLAIKLVSDLGQYHCIILRNKVDAASFSRLNVGIQSNEQTND